MAKKIPLIRPVTSPIKTNCKGLDNKGDEVLEKPVNVRLQVVEKPRFGSIEMIVMCPYITGGHQDKCKAFDQKETGQYDIYCKYHFGITYIIRVRELNREFQMGYQI